MSFSQVTYVRVVQVVTAGFTNRLTEETFVVMNVPLRVTHWFVDWSAGFRTSSKFSCLARLRQTICKLDNLHAFTTIFALHRAVVEVKHLVFPANRIIYIKALNVKSN